MNGKELMRGYHCTKATVLMWVSHGLPHEGEIFSKMSFDANEVEKWLIENKVMNHWTTQELKQNYNLKKRQYDVWRSHGLPEQKSPLFPKSMRVYNILEVEQWVLENDALNFHESKSTTNDICARYNITRAAVSLFIKQGLPNEKTIYGLRYDMNEVHKWMIKNNKVNGKKNRKKKRQSETKEDLIITLKGLNKWKSDWQKRGVDDSNKIQSLNNLIEGVKKDLEKFDKC